MDPGIDLVAGLRVNLQDFRIPGLHAAIKDNGRGQSDMVPVDRLVGTVNVSRGFKAGKKGPEEFLQVFGGRVRVVDQENHGPVCQFRLSGSR